MRKMFVYRIYPTKAQATRMSQTIDECRWLYNHLLEQRRVYWEEAHVAVDLHDQHAYLPYLKADRASLASVHSQVLQNVCERLDLAFKAFFRRVKAGETPGYPRFRGKDRYDSFCYPQCGSGAKLVGNYLHLSKIGNIEVVLHRPIEGKPKTICIRRSSTGKWYAVICCDWEPTTLPDCPKQVGIDVGLNTFAALSDGTDITNPRFFRQEERNLAKANRRHSRAERGSARRKKHRKVVARVHERIKWRRRDFAHQHSRSIVNSNGLIAVENLSVNRMVHNHCLAKSISDAAWSDFSELLRVKAEWAGRVFIAVNPAYTSQTCSSCGHRQKMPLSERIFDCPCCSLHINRDLNASLNILALGLQSIRNQSVEAPSASFGE
jgi:putative transposase